MSYPNIIFGDYGDEKVQSVAKIGSLPLGTRMYLPDGRIFAHAKAGGTTLVRGNLTQTMDTVDNHDTDQELTAAAVGATAITVTLGDADATLNQYADGYLVVNDGTAEGEIYKVKSCASAAASSSCVITLEDGDGIITAFTAATTEVGLRVNEFQGLTIWRAGTVEGIPCGIAPREVTADYYFWVQRRGAAGCFVDGSHSLGEGVVPGEEGIDGALDVRIAGSASGSTFETQAIGYTMTVQSSTEYGMCYLTLD